VLLGRKSDVPSHGGGTTLCRDCCRQECERALSKKMDENFGREGMKKTGQRKRVGKRTNTTATLLSSRTRASQVSQLEANASFIAGV
jgi:hypothetical protein